MWKAKTKNGKEFSEIKSNWSEIDEDITELMLVTDNGQSITLPKNMNKYIQAKTASASLGAKNIQIESRYIGFEIGSNIIRIRVNEKTKNISVEVEPIN